ncbi:CamS family sex pheromone protein [Hydrogenibacillus sp. N12]|uniref:CamS family sex pheromone protein n=1 Tax=Hydrogenibacillus sp. N12 TaxID=2866627 RepID=UPI001C7D46AB|nr:CamS family sex pheromone protein [Hydrogenibacillus sp. N12]QZA33304.1 CamS family sex pheromone protein [Hydrogenibacillus sp. N12]
MSRLGRGLRLAAAAAFFLLAAGCLPKPATEGGAPPAASPPARPPEVTSTIPPEGVLYRMPLPYRPGQGQPPWEKVSRVDRARFELGLMALSRKTFPPETHLYEDGQLLSAEEIGDWLKPYDPEQNPVGLNDPAYRPSASGNVFQFFWEQDYLDAQTGALAGVTVGMVLNPTVDVPAESKAAGQGTNNPWIARPLKPEELDRYARDAGEKIARRLREKGVDGPIVLGAYLASPRTAFEPGHFFLTGELAKGAAGGVRYTPVSERYLLLPALQVSEADKRLSLVFDEFKEALERAFPQFLSVVGLARLDGDRLLELDATITASYRSQGQVMGLAEYAATLVTDRFPPEADVEVIVQSASRPIALIVRPPGKETFVHLFRQ